MIISGISVTESLCFCTTVFILTFGFGFSLISYFDYLDGFGRQVRYWGGERRVFILRLDFRVRRKCSIEYVSCQSNSQTFISLCLPSSKHSSFLKKISPRIFHLKKFGSLSNLRLLLADMNRREYDRDRRPPKRSRSPDERERSPREDKRRRSYANEKRTERSRSPRTTRSSTAQNGRDERHYRREERKERDSRSKPPQGIAYNDYLTKLDEPHRYDRDRKPPPPSNSRSEPAKRTSDRKPPSTKPPSAMTETPSKSKPITSATLLEEEEDPPISKLMGFSRFSTTKGKKHEDYGAVDLIKKRTYRQYMNRPGGFNRPLD